MKVHLVDGTYELFRNYYGAPKRLSPDGREVGATIGLLRSLVALLARPDVTHVAYAFDHVIESFRNGLYPGYKTRDGIEPDLLRQFNFVEEGVSALGVVVWSMVEFEADDALATGAARFRELKEVEQVVICSPDKDLTQCVRGKKVVCWDRRRDILLDDEGVVKKFGVPPRSIPDWLALVGDSADGYPGIEGWGEKSAATILGSFHHLEAIPGDHKVWNLEIRRAESLSENLEKYRAQATLYRKLATLREDVPVKETLDDLCWRGADERFKAFCASVGEADLPNRIVKWQSR